jgi:hypothetical protein
MSSIQMSIDKLLAVPWVQPSIVVFLVVFAAHTRPNSGALNKFVTSTFGQFIMFSLIAYFSTKDIMTSVVLAIVFGGIFNLIKNKESFTGNYTNTVDYMINNVYTGAIPANNPAGYDSDNLAQKAYVPNVGNTTCTPGLMGNALCKKSLMPAYSPTQDYSALSNAFSGTSSCGAAKATPAAAKATPAAAKATQAALKEKFNGTQAPTKAAAKVSTKAPSQVAVQPVALPCSSLPHYNEVVQYQINNAYGCPLDPNVPAGSLSQDLCAPGTSGGSEYQPVDFGTNAKAQEQINLNVPGSVYIQKSRSTAQCPWNTTSNQVGLVCKQ